MHQWVYKQHYTSSFLGYQASAQRQQKIKPPGKSWQSSTFRS